MHSPTHLASPDPAPSHPLAGARVHLSLEVTDLEASRRFYGALLQCRPSKERPGYVKFAPEHLRLNLALQQGPHARGVRGSEHFGIELDSAEAVAAQAQRLREAGLATRDELGTTCCHAVQDKVWARDPDGRAWEFFTVLDADPKQPMVVQPTAVQASDTAACCAPDCCAP